MSEQESPVEWKGQHTQVHTAAQISAKTQDEWTKLWDAAHSSSHFPPPAAPALPEGKMALGIFLGMQSSPDTVEVTGVAEAGGQTVVNWKTVEPPFNGNAPFVATVMHEPYLLKWVDKTDTPVVFQRENAPAPMRPFDLSKIEPIRLKPMG